MRAIKKEITVLKGGETIRCTSGGMYLVNYDDELFFNVSQLQKASVITTDGGPEEDDMGLILDMGERAYLMMSEHPNYREVLFHELCKMIPIDYRMVIVASKSTANAEFVIYSKEKEVMQ